MLWQVIYIFINNKHVICTYFDDRMLDILKTANMYIDWLENTSTRFLSMLICLFYEVQNCNSPL